MHFRGKWLLPKIPVFKFARRFGFPAVLPINLTVSLTYRCNSRCRTCSVYDRKAEEFSFEEFKRTFASIGRGVYWVTFSGGEPFLRKDIVDICKCAYENLRPRIMNIPTNGLMPERIEGCVKAILNSCPDSNIIVNLSIDGIGEKHDEIRGARSGFEKAMETYRKLRALNHPNLTLGIHTVISKFNVKEIPLIYRNLMELKPDSYITEIAEERVELGTIGADIAPPPDEYASAVDFITKEMLSLDLKLIPRITRAFRTIYYQMVKATLRDRKEIIPCYAAVASCQIAPDGEVWACCIKAESMGNLRDAGYNFRKVWFSSKAKKMREDIKRMRCCCPLANASYTNMLFSFRILFKVFGLVWSPRRAGKDTAENISLKAEAAKR